MRVAAALHAAACAVFAAVFTAAAFTAAPAHADDAERAIRTAFSRSDATPQEADLKRLYELHGFRPVWTPPLAAAAMQALAQSADEGLNPADYPVEQLPQRATEKAAAAWDLQLTRIFLRYAKDAHFGRLAP